MEKLLQKFFSKGCLLGNLLGGNIIYTVLVRGNKQQVDGRQSCELGSIINVMEFNFEFP